jgi:FixJ family two-component response regulator
MSRSQILLVDDDPAVRSSIAFALEIEGFDVRAFESAEAVLASRGAGTTACIILDHRLPGIDGLALLDRLRAKGIGAPAIVITSNPNRSLRQRIEDAGARLIEKPLLGDSLATTIREFTIDQGRTER